VLGFCKHNNEASHSVTFWKFSYRNQFSVCTFKQTASVLFFEEGPVPWTKLVTYLIP